MPTSFERLKNAISDRYEIEREVGHGAMATVYLARDVKHNRQVAIKVLLTEVGFALGPERFRREIDLAAHLSHPHILPIYDSGDADGELYYVMPYVAGESLRARLNRERQLPVDEALRITCEVASALDHSHRHGIIHRDIKPENILLEDGQALVADFGIARAVSTVGEEKLTSTGISLGTPTYMSPEQGMADPNLDRRSDIYSLGCVLYEMLAGQPPFTGRTTQALLARHSLDNVPSLSIIRNTIPEEVEDAIMRSLAKVPADRFSTAAEFADALRACQTGTYVAHRTGRRTGAQRIKKRNWRALALPAALAVIVVGTAAWAGKAFLFGGQSRSAGSAVVGGFEYNRLAVLYFKDLSPDKSLGYLADGLTESLISELDRVSTLDVVSPGGVKPFRERDVPPDSIARALQVGTLVEGTVESDRAGRNARVILRLVDGNSGAEFNRTQVDESLGDPLALRTKLTVELSDMLRKLLGDEVRLRKLRAGTENPVAWSLVQRAEKMRKDAESFEQGGKVDSATQRLYAADTLLAQAEARDPKWAEPIVLRGVLTGRHERMTRDPAEIARWINVGLGHAERAIALDPRDSKALELRGSLRVRRIGRGLIPDQRARDDSIRVAERDLRAAIASNPTQAIALVLLSGIQYAKPDIAEAHNLAQKAYEADAYLSAAPEILWRLFSTAYDLEQFLNAEKWCNEERRRFPQHLFSARCHLLMMTTKAVRPDPTEAWQRARELERVSPPQRREYYAREGQIMAAAVLARAGLPDSARRVLVRARADREIDPGGELMPMEAFVRTMLGDKTEAINLLQRAVGEHPEHHRGFAKVNFWWWRPLQDEPRFKTMMALGG
jgi:TolB-like protein